MAVGDIYQLTLKGLAFTSDTVNVFGYRQTALGTSPSPAAALAVAFDTDVMPGILQIQTDAQLYHSIEVFNYTNALDFALLTGAGITNNQGTYGAVPALPAGVTAGFKYTRSVFGIRSGSKRFSSLPETQVGNYEVTASLKVRLDVTAVALAASPVDLGDTFEPIVIYGPRVLGFAPNFYIPAGITFSLIGRQNSRIVPTTILP